MIKISILEFEGTLQRTDFDVLLILFYCSIEKNLSQVSVQVFSILGSTATANIV